MSRKFFQEPKLIADVIKWNIGNGVLSACLKELQELGQDFDTDPTSLPQDTIINKLIEYKYSFLNFVKEVNGLCTRYCCTTCCNMHYRAILDFLGEEKMRKLLKNVTYEELKKYNIDFWLEPFLILMNDMPELYFEDILIVKEFRRSRAAYESKKLRIIKEKEEEIQARKEAKLEQKRLNSQKHQDYIVARNQYLTEFRNLTTLNEKLLYIVEDKSHHPLYFNLDFDAIKDGELEALPVSTINKLYKKFSQIKHKRLRDFNARLSALNN